MPSNETENIPPPPSIPRVVGAAAVDRHRPRQSSRRHRHPRRIAKSRPWGSWGLGKGGFLASCHEFISNKLVSFRFFWGESLGLRYIDMVGSYGNCRWREPFFVSNFSNVGCFFPAKVAKDHPFLDQKMPQCVCFLLLKRRVAHFIFGRSKIFR